MPAPAPPPTEPATTSAIAYFRVATAGGLVLTLHGELMGVAAGVDAAHAVIAIVPAAMTNICVLVAPDSRPFRVAADPDHGIATSALLLRADAKPLVRLQYPLGRSFLVLDPAAPADGPALRFDGHGETPEVAFVLVALADNAVPMAARALGREIGRAAALGLRAATLLAGLRDGGVRPELALSLVRVMPRDEMAELSRRLVERPADLAVLRRGAADEVWLRAHLPALAAWQAGREPAGAVESGAGDEATLLPAAFSALLAPAGLVLQSLARKTVMPRRNACVLACARNEGAYLLDWISYHLSIGFEHIFLYTNNNDDGSDELLGLLAQSGVVTWVRNVCGPNMSPQLKCYAHALRILPQILDFRWAAVLDLDEYVAFDPARYTSFPDFMGQLEVQSTDAVALCWLLNAAGSLDRWSAESSLTRFPMRDPSVNPHVKTVCRPRLFWFSYPHDPVPVLSAPFEFRSPNGGWHHHAGVHGRGASFAEHPSADRAWINHYILRSAEEALWKRARGQGVSAASSPESRRSLQFIADSFLNLARPEYLVEDRRIIECARGQAAVLDGLRRLPGVSTCDDAIKAKFGARLAANTRLFLDTPLPEDASARVVAFRELVREQQLL